LSNNEKTKEQQQNCVNQRHYFTTGLLSSPPNSKLPCDFHSSCEKGRRTWNVGLKKMEISTSKQRVAVPKRHCVFYCTAKSVHYHVINAT
jgi:hypothetical protein